MLSRMSYLIQIIIILNIHISFERHSQVQAINQVLSDYLSTFKLTSDLELAKNTPLDEQLHFITPQISNFKNELLEQTFFILSKNTAQYDYINPIQTVNSMSKCSIEVHQENDYVCLLQLYNSTQFNFTKEKLVIFGSFDSFNPIESLSNFKHDLVSRFQSVEQIKISNYWLQNRNKYNDFKHDIDLNVHIVFKFKGLTDLFYTNHVVNFYSHPYWDPDYLLYDNQANFLTGIYPIKYKNEIIFNFTSQIKKTDKLDLVYGLKSTTSTLSFSVENDFNLCNINYFVIMYSNDYDNKYSKHYSYPNVFSNASQILTDTCSTDYNINYNYYQHECPNVKSLQDSSKPKICDMKSNLVCQLNKLTSKYDCSLTLKNISFAAKYRFYIKAITKANEDIWMMKSSEAFTDVTVPFEPVNIKINLVKSYQDVPVINLLVPPLDNQNGNINKVYIYMINHGNERTFQLIDDMYPRLFDPRNQNDLKDFVSNMNQKAVCSFNSPLNDPCRVDFNTNIRNKNYLLTNLVTDQIRRDFSESIINQCSFIQMNSTYQFMFIFEIDYFVGKVAWDGSVGVDYENKVFFTANPIEPINPSFQISNINNLNLNSSDFRLELKSSFASKIQCDQRVIYKSNTASVATLATFMTLSIIFNFFLMGYILRSKIKMLIYMV